MTILTDQEIAELLAEEKILPENYRDRLLVKLKTKGGHRQGEVMVQGVRGNTFFIKTRENVRNKFDFSVILVYDVPETSRQFRLTRYNGRTQQHRNRLENQVVKGFHIHLATERYQEAGYDEDAFAQHTDRYVDMYSALKCLIDDCNFRRPASDPPELL